MCWLKHRCKKESGYRRKKDFRAFPQDYVDFLSYPSHRPKYEPKAQRTDCFRSIFFYFMCASVYLHACLYVQCPGNHRRASNFPSPGATLGATSWVPGTEPRSPGRAQCSLCWAVSPVPGKQRRWECERKVSAFPAGTLNPHGSPHTLDRSWINLFQHILLIWKTLVY